VATRKGAGTTARKKYVPSEEQIAKDERLKEKLNHLNETDLREFDRLLEKAIGGRGTKDTQAR
jgi:hypothetical protein